MNAPTRRPGAPTEPPAAKRQRKAINCEPCRASKLKCDRNRPCSSCVLRGTTAQCYQGADAALYRPPSFPQPATVSPTLSSSNPSANASFDATFYFGQIRQALSALETQFGPNQTAIEFVNVRGKGKEPETQSEIPARALGRTEGDGLYSGPTTLVAHLMPNGDSRSLRDGVSSNTAPQPHYPGTRAFNIDADLRKELPHLSVVDGLIDYYFDYCSWVYKHIDRLAFTARWQEFKASPSSSYSRLLLATEAIICAIAIHYLPPQHELAKSLNLYPSSGDESGRRGSISRMAESDRSSLLASSRSDELGVRWYNVCRAALAREQAERRTYNLDVIEILLARGHFLTLTKIDTEEIWSVRGELITIATAMGLHRDPGTRMPPFVAERRRWAWSHIITLERWQAFMQGRPLAISPDHYDTKFPSADPIPLLCPKRSSTRLSHPSPSQINTSPPSPPAVLRTPESIASPSSIGGPHSDEPAVDERNADVDSQEEAGTRTYEAHIALFRLATILGGIMTDAVRLTPVDYERVMMHDEALENWLKNLPDGLSITPSEIASNLASYVTGFRRQGVQALVLRMAALHIRFTLHRPYATQVVGSPYRSAGGEGDYSSAPIKDVRVFSLIVALEAAKELIELVAVAAPGALQQDASAVPGHLNWAPVHLFSATMFIIFTIVNSPPGPNTTSQPMDIDRDARPVLFDAQSRIPNINRAIDTLRRITFLPTAGKALEVLEALAPFYHSDYIDASVVDRERIKRDVLPRVQGMGMPYHEGGTLSVVGGSDGGRDEGHLERPRARVGSSASSHTLPSFNSLALQSDYRHHANDNRAGGTRRIPTPGATPPPSWTNSHIRDPTVRAGESSSWRTGSSNNGQDDTWEDGYAGQGSHLPERRMSSGLSRPDGPSSNAAQTFTTSRVHGHAMQSGQNWDGLRTASQTASAFPHDVGDPPAAAYRLPALTWSQTSTAQAGHASSDWSQGSPVPPYTHSGASPSNVLSGFNSGDAQPGWAFDLPQVSGYGSNVWPPQQTQATGWIPPSTDEHASLVQSGGFGHGMPGFSGMQSFAGFGFSDIEMQLMLGDQNMTPIGNYGGTYQNAYST